MFTTTTIAHIDDVAKHTLVVCLVPPVGFEPTKPDGDLNRPLHGLGLNILLDGDPQAGYPAILVLTDNQSRLSVFTLSRLSQARGNPPP